MVSNDTINGQLFLLMLICFYKRTLDNRAAGFYNKTKPAIRFMFVKAAIQSIVDLCCYK